MFLIRGIEFNYEAVRDWEAKLTPTLIDNLRRRTGRIGKRLTVVGYFQTYRDMQAKSDAALKKPVKYLGPDGPRQPVAAVYTLDRLKDAVAQARHLKRR